MGESGTKTIASCSWRVPSTSQIAYGITKPISSSRFKDFTTDLGVREIIEKQTEASGLCSGKVAGGDARKGGWYSKKVLK